MSDVDESMSYLDDDDFLVAGTPEETTRSNRSETPRPAKRRRLEAGKSGQNGGKKPKKRTEDEFDDNGSLLSGSDSFIDDDEDYDDYKLPPYEEDEEEDKEAHTKHKVFVPKNNNFQENIFVTQLTQPPSPPEMIRGPRWKKPDPPKPPTNNTVVPTDNGASGGAAGDEFDDDEDMKAAIAASLNSFEEEISRVAPLPAPKDPAPQPRASSGGQSNDPAPFDIEDIPEDAFDSDISLSPPPRPVQTQFTLSRNQPTGLRQTTLFNMAHRNMDMPMQIDEQDLAPPEKNEPPTQHKLDEEAIRTWVYPTNLGKTRDYQYNITQRGLFHNLLVALPTGLGKTFIAATIMLNWFRWTKSAQIVFVAPTKPLVAQQISACFGIAGIPRSQTTMLTGEAAPGIRAEQWQNKRVFFMTPQTLINDLKTGIADPKRIVLLVVDEAHRATGGYAYVEVVKFLRRFNKSFRVLALTATPGSTVESVQAVIDGLEISRVEIRTEQSIDIREYVHARNTDVETFQNSEEMVLCMDLFSKVLQPLVNQLNTMNAYWGKDPMMLTAYGLTKARQQWMLSDAGRNAHFGLKGKVNSIFTVLASLAHSIDLLKYHGITPFYRHLMHFQSGIDPKKGGKYQRQVVQDDNYKKLMSHLQPWTKNPEFIGHPKLEYLKSVVLNHFMDAGEGQGTSEGESQSVTRVMIFVHFRDSAEEVVRVLSRYGPMIRPHVFVGQSSAKDSEGMNQKTQLGIVEKFKKGTYNTIVATSIGEEGLDIGEVDLIVCYDSSASPIRMLQRMGRTGRKRAGNIVLLLMQGKEEESYIKAKDNYEKMQQMIANGSRFTFHDDKSPRILPPGVRPAADKRHIEIPVENKDSDLPEPRRRARAPKKPPKTFHMPDDVETGFTKASSLAGGSNTKKSEDKRIRTPTPEPVDIPSLEEVELTATEQRELEHRYQNIGGTSPQFIRFPRNDAFPRLQLVPRPTKVVRHGSMTHRMINALRKMDNVSSDCDNRYKKILELESTKEDSLARDQSTWQKPKTPKPRTKSRPSRPFIQSDDELFCRDENRQSSPPEVLPSLDELKAKAFCASQTSINDDLESNFDLPDIDTLLSANKQGGF
ncbi:hypothetical protein ASPWEDRAFT_49664 [Aspergillus wentii DTO 134E9]|uniref:ATP-dependent DNA helicase n=1 Tax=Aspergillus wentii DTO 134E9 TaxID=1073089 RepID=A0A1L9RXV8_ASPWE|nr:uncharacterized protein ASPWEDRAFT_49664 [Aspergillus wentii DTO 134E9]OJJ39781.1 hypothetical protein ASPWEDRAFT_49664 [Aspergillus wentii DTO 134E9]